MHPFILLIIVYPDKLQDNRDDIAKMLRFFSVFFSFFTTFAFASNFMTPQDLLNNESPSNIFLQNNGSAAVTVYGLYVNQYAYVTPGQSCDSATIIYPSSNNVTAGAFVMPVAIGSGQKVPVGSNYLYNMIFTAIYYENMTISTLPPGCALPGCTWGSDTTQYDWCIYLGAMAPVYTSAGYTSNVPPAAETASDQCFYNYNLINSYINLGPISCNDETMTCSISSPQTQSFSNVGIHGCQK